MPAVSSTLMGVESVADLVYRQAATSHTTSRTSKSGLTLDEIETRYLWSIQASRKHDLRAFARTVFGEALEFGEMLGADSTRLLHLWPHKALLLCAQPELPDSSRPFSSMLTDVSHGLCELGLGGEQAFEFLACYSSANPVQTRIHETRNLRCLFGQYQVTLWWDQRDDIRILIDRSYAQSFCDYFEHLLQRWG
ncbi:MAG: hypothetical protein GY896_18345 [Gammaproteobacteria bacterium]|nr:hypothetical protein [Gammaproteobacteria bacterium]